MKGIIFDIRHFSVNDGPGIRTTVFFKGCPLRCRWCHNPEGQSFDPESYTRINKLTGREFEVREVAGNSVSVSQVMGEIEKDIPVYDESGGGVTFSGGEPLGQPAFLMALLNACAGKQIHTAVDTCGYAGKKDFEQVIPLTSLFLFDLKIAKDEEHKRHTGVSVTPVLRNLENAAAAGKEIIIRIPLVSGITDTGHNLSRLRDIAASFSGVSRVDLLPYHSTGICKYPKFGRSVAMDCKNGYDENRAEKIKEFFLEKLPEVTIGG